MEKKQFYLLIGSSYVAQGMLYHIIFSFFPVFFELHRDSLSFSLNIQSFFIIFVQFQYLVKVLFSSHLDRKRKQQQMPPGGVSHVKVLKRICVYSGLIALLMHFLGMAHFGAILVCFVLLSYGVATQDALVDDLIIRGTTPVERVKFSSTYNIAYAMGSLVIFNLFLGTLSPAQGDLGAWEIFFQRTALLVTGFAGLAFFLKRSSLVETKPPAQIDLQGETHAREDSVLIKQGIKMAKSDYMTKIFRIVLAFAFFINIGALAEYTLPQYIVREFGQEGFSLVAQFESYAILINIFTFLLFIGKAELFVKYYIRVLKGTAAFYIGFWLVLVYLPLELLAAFTLINLILGSFLIVSLSLIFMDYAPSTFKATVFQVFGLAFFLPALLLPVIGTYMAAAWGDGLVFTLIGVTTLIVLGLLFLLERRVRTYRIVD